MFAYCIGQCGIKVDEYWRLTEAETIGIIAGHHRIESYESERLRNIYGLLAGHFGVKGSVKQMWPIATDYENQVSQEYIENRNKGAIEIAKKLGIMPNNAEC